MTWSNVRWIFARELRDQLRDRRMLFTITVLPLLLYPLLTMSFVQITQFQREHVSPVLLLRADALPASPALLADGRFAAEWCPDDAAALLELSVPADEPSEDDEQLRRRAELAVADGEFDAVVLFPKTFAEQLARYHSDDRGPVTEDTAAAAAAAPIAADVLQPEIFVDTASDKSCIAGNRIERVLEAWRGGIVRQNLAVRRVPDAVTEPFAIVSTDVAEADSRRAAIWSRILPFVVLIWALTGAFYPAIDLCAGEKERGTLETLLCSPAQRSEIVYGKLLTVMTFSMITSLLNLASMGLTGWLFMSQLNALGGPGHSLGLGPPPVSAWLWLVLTLVPISALFSALSLAIASFARSSKEGQYYLMPLLMITLPLMMLPLMPAAELDWGTSLIPVTGAVLLLQALIESEYLLAARFALPVVSVTLACCWFAVRWAIDQFNNESVLFRENERWGLSVWVRHMVRDRGDTPTLAEGMLCGFLLLIIHFFASLSIGVPTDWLGFAKTQTISLIAFIAAPAVLMAVILTRSPRKTLLLQWPRPSSVAMAILLAVTIHPVGFAVGRGVQQLYPFNDEMLSQVQLFGSLLDGMQNSAGLWAVLLVIAVVPAVCEELAFRGFILSGLRHLGHRGAAIIISSLFFGATHGILQQSLPAFAVGLVIGYLAVQTGSLLPCILFHVVYNSMTIVLATAIPTAAFETTGWSWLLTGTGDAFAYRTTAIVAGAVASAALLYWFYRLPHESTREESWHDALDRSQHARPVMEEA